MVSDSLVISSVAVIIVRLAAIVIFTYVAILQHAQFKNITTLQPLKRLLFYIPITIIVSNIPQLALSYNRIHSIHGEVGLTSVATLSNAVGVLLTAVLLLLVYRYKSDN